MIIFFEEAFSLYRKIDMTSMLLSQGYIASYNTPITEEVYNKLAYDPASKYFFIQRTLHTLMF